MNITENPCCKTVGVFGDGTCGRLAELVHCRNCPEYARSGRQLFEQPLPQQDLLEWTELLGREKETEPEGTISAAMFRIRGEWFALKTACLQEITDLRPVHAVPYRSGDVFKGVANINGELLLCVDPAAVLGISAEASAYGRMIVSARDGQRFALMVEEVLGVHRIAQAVIAKPPATVAKSPEAFTAGLFTFEGKSIGLLDEQLLFEALAGSIAG